MSEHVAGRRPTRGGAHPIYSALLPVPIVCFIGALFTDWAYTASPDMMWIDFSSWLLLAGLIVGGIALAVLAIKLFRTDRRGPLGLHFLLLGAAWVVELFNSFVHTRDGWTAVEPTGITLSVIAVILSLAAGWVWQSFAHGRSGDIR